jgi:hypothetical protein
LDTGKNIPESTQTLQLQQLDPAMKAQWDKIVTDFPKLFAFLTELNKLSRGSWKVSPAQFTQVMNKHITGVAGAKGMAQTAPFASR